MTDELIIQAPNKRFEEIKKIDEEGVEYWEARELMPLLDYGKWSNFEKVVIEKAKVACKNSKQSVSNHFADIGKMIKIAVGTSKEATKRRIYRPHIFLVQSRNVRIIKPVIPIFLALATS